LALEQAGAASRWVDQGPAASCWAGTAPSRWASTLLGHAVACPVQGRLAQLAVAQGWAVSAVAQRPGQGAGASSAGAALARDAVLAQAVVAGPGQGAGPAGAEWAGSCLVAAAALEQAERVVAHSALTAAAQVGAGTAEGESSRSGDRGESRAPGRGVQGARRAIPGRPGGRQPGSGRTGAAGPGAAAAATPAGARSVSWPVSATGGGASRNARPAPALRRVSSAVPPPGCGRCGAAGSGVTGAECPAGGYSVSWRGSLIMAAGHSGAGRAARAGHRG